MTQVLLIGAGGLGCGAALALGAGGCKSICVVDDDVVQESNLPRQVLHTEDQIGRSKVDSLAAALGRRFPALSVNTVSGRFDVNSAMTLLANVEVVLDGSDNLATKFLVNDAAVIARRPLVHAAAVGTGGQLMTVLAGGHPCYRCLFEELPAPESGVGESCAQAGVLGPVPGVLGALQAVEALRILAGEKPAFAGRVIRYDSLSMTIRTIKLKPNPACRVCGRAADIRDVRGDDTLTRQPPPVQAA